MRIGETLEPGHRALRLLGQREHALRRHVVDDVELVVHLRDHALVGRAGIDIGEIFRPGLADLPDGGALPVIAQLPDVPPAVGIVIVQHVGAERDRLVEVELQGVLDLLEHVLGHDPYGVPAHREEGVEAGVRLLQLEDDRIGIGRLHGVDGERQRRAPAHVLVLDLRRHGVHDVGRRELDAIAPEYPAPQLDGHLREVGVVGRLLRRQGVLPHAVEPAIGVDVPEGVEGCLLQPVRLAAGVDGPDVEPSGILDGPLGILEDQGLVARQVGEPALRQELAGRRHQRQCSKQQRECPGTSACHGISSSMQPCFARGSCWRRRYTWPSSRNKPNRISIRHSDAKAFSSRRVRFSESW